MSPRIKAMLVTELTFVEEMKTSYESGKELVNLGFQSEGQDSLLNYGRHSFDDGQRCMINILAVI
jgi:hypothetical protein